MKVLVFLYPIKEYVDASLNRYRDSETPKEYARYKPERFCQILDRRYRRKGYKIIWIMFSEKDERSEPDGSQLSEFMSIEAKDEVFANGVTFKDHCSFKLYPDPNHILRCLPDNKDEITDLVIAGFHLNDCIDKLASCAYNQGLPVRVDDDLTELYFCRTWLHGPLPYIRRVPAYVSTMRDMDEIEKELYLGTFKNRPWLKQPVSPQ